MKRPIGVSTKGIGIGMSIKKELDALMMAILCCNVKRPIGVSTKGIGIGMSIKKELDALMMALA